MECLTFKDVVKRLDEEYDPEPRRTDPWDEIVMTILSQNTSDENRDVAYKRLTERYRSPDDIMSANLDEIRELIKPCGLMKSKSKYLKNAARYIVEEHGGDTDWIRDNPPEEVHDELTNIKGIGHKTADVVLLFSAGANLCPVDTHVHRVTHRLGIVRNSSRKKTRDRLIELRDECGVDLRNAHVSLISHGRRTCTARQPACSRCAVEDVCEKVDVEEQ